MRQDTMRAIEARAFSIDALTLTERPVPAPGAGEILVRVKAATLNYRDLAVLIGGYMPALPLPFIPVSDACGVVEAVGEGVTRFAVGDRVVPCYIQTYHSGLITQEQRTQRTIGAPRDGVLRDYMTVPAEDAVHAPAHLSDLEAAALPIAGLTAWTCLMTGGLQPGGTILVQGTGGVSLFALQLAKAFGGRVIALTSTAEKADLLKRLGADAVINYRDTPNWAGPVREATGGKGVDIVVETAGATLSESLAATAYNGFIGVIGFVGGQEASVNIRQLIGPGARVQGIIVGHRDGLEALGRAMEVSDIHPVMDKAFPLEQAADAFHHLKAANHIGKVGISF